MNPNLKKLPDAFLSRLGLIFPATKAPQLLDTFTHLKPTTFRINSLKTSPTKLAPELRKAGFDYKQLNWHKNGCILKERRQTKSLINSEFFENGLIYLQSLSSMLPALILNPAPGEKILDLCAAPGSKTTQIAAMMKNEGEILAIEKFQIRYDKLQANLQRQGIKIATAQFADGKYTWIEKPDYFDRVLVDAPCTNEALFNTIYPRSFKRWREKHILAMARLQTKLLISGLRSLKPGGLLLYCTCTYGPEENERTVSNLLEQFPRHTEVLPLGTELPNFSPALREYGREKFAESLLHARRVLPTSEMHGFFLCLIRKKEVLPQQDEAQ